MDAESHRISAGGVSAAISAEGAELVSLKDAAGEEFLWQAGPQWPRHAPVLFPIVGRLANDTLHHDGRDYRITQHGFARDARFAWRERSETRAALVLQDDAATRAMFPFAFRLELIYVVESATLAVTTRVTNPGEATLHCGVGAHPGFRWPLVDGIAKDAHRIVFETRETGPALGVEGGLLGGPKPLPFDGRSLPLDEALFASDALVMPAIASRSLRYEALDADRRTAACDVRCVGRIRRSRHLVEAGRCALCLHRTLGVDGKPGRVRWTVRGKARHSVLRSGGNARFHLDRLARRDMTLALDQSEAQGQVSGGRNPAGSFVLASPQDRSICDCSSPFAKLRSAPSMRARNT